MASESAGATMEEKRALEQQHRLHYRWSQLEADRCGVNIGSPLRPLPTANRILDLDPNRKYEESDWPLMTQECPEALAKFSSCAGVYKTIEYNTFGKNGPLKLSEIELYFISSKVTRESASDWALVYLGVGTGERFRWLRDNFFPGLSVIAFDPLDGFYHQKETIEQAAEKWNNDGSGWTYVLRCFDMEKDSEWVLEKLQGKKMLLITDLRGIHYVNVNGDANLANVESNGTKPSSDSTEGNGQWQIVKRLRPERSLVKFQSPHHPWNQEFMYAPGTLVKLIYGYYGTRELRLMIDGVPEKFRRYNVWELYAKMQFHHEHLRGQVYKTTRNPNTSKCLDCSFDATVLWDTLSSYAKKNSMEPNKVLDTIIKYHVYAPADKDSDWANYVWSPPTPEQRWGSVEVFLQSGKFMEAIAALEAEGEDGGKDWADIVKSLHQSQPYLAQRLKLCLHRPASRAALIQVLGSLSDPFTLIGSSYCPLNISFEEDKKEEADQPEERPHKRRCTVWGTNFSDLSESQQKAALSLGWGEATWNSNQFHLPRNKAWDKLDKDMKQSLMELGESEDTWDVWKP